MHTHTCTLTHTTHTHTHTHTYIHVHIKQGRRDAERELAEFQARMSGDPEVEKKLRKQIKKYKALLEDAQEALEHEKESRNNAAVLRSLRSQLEDFELREATAVKAQKRLQSDMDELQAQCDEVSRLKIEVSRYMLVCSDLDTHVHLCV